MNEACAVADFRESEGWNETRFVVSALLEFTESWSRRLKYKRLAKDIERLSVSLLDNITQGYERKGSTSHLRKAERTLHELELALESMLHQGALKKSESERLKEQLQFVKRSLKNIEP